jgi:ketosteroid isomerase-like protein
MTTVLPPAISQYFTAAGAADVDALVDCFTSDAVVVDEDRTWRGQAAIRSWRENVATAYRYTLDVVGTDPRGEAGGLERHDVRTHLEGDFPGGTVDLVYRFGLRDGHIASLEIG